ncbi:MAG: DUF3576 domain-containing protein [Alphaproteobacteria bacterium]
MQKYAIINHGFPKIHRRLIALAVAACLLSACGSGVNTEAKFPDKKKDEEYKQGSLLSDEGGMLLFGPDKAKDGGASGITVNAYLWRAALDTVSFMPLLAADPFGGTILTDWYASPGNPNERMKLNVFILDRELRADGVRVKAFKQIRAEPQGWADAAVEPSVATALEEAVLTRARQMKVAQKQKPDNK